MMQTKYNRYSAHDIPEQQRFFTTREICEELGVSENTVRNIVKRLDIEYEIRPVGNQRNAYYSWLQYQKIIEYQKQHKSEKKIKQELTVTDEKLQDHPLVKDTRCLSFSYWPDIEPVCFKDLDK